MDGIVKVGGERVKVERLKRENVVGPLKDEVWRLRKELARISSVTMEGNVYRMACEALGGERDALRLVHRIRNDAKMAADGASGVTGGGG